MPSVITLTSQAPLVRTPRAIFPCRDKKAAIIALLLPYFIKISPL